MRRLGGFSLALSTTFCWVGLQKYYFLFIFVFRCFVCVCVCVLCVCVFFFCVCVCLCVCLRYSRKKKGFCCFFAYPPIVEFESEGVGCCVVRCSVEVCVCEIAPENR